ncbi:MAG: hypothetical protein LBE36_06180 [Flavobacteriaceae bacterium]|jgi:hypothetical protein|nr:hypothetical protein [Flavobacteriaceae bacterium]
MGGVSYGNYVKIKREIFPTSVNFECTKITEYNIGINETKEVRFKVGGKNDDKKRKIEFVLNNTNISLSTKEWNAENEWILLTKITGKTEGETIITIKVEGTTLNSIKIKCINYKDVFSEKDVKRLINENKISISMHTACIIAADKQLGKLLRDNKNFITETSNNGANVYTVYTRIEQLKKKGFLANEKIFPADTYKGKGYYEPKEYTSGNEHVISSFLSKSLGNRLGYHIFYFTILDGYHVLTLVVDNNVPCERKFKIYDQIRDRGSYIDFIEIDNELLKMNTNNWPGAASLTESKTVSTKFGIWKIQRK